MDNKIPDLAVVHWIDATGGPLKGGTSPLRETRFHVVFCFQHACPGCHQSGFVTLTELVNRFGPAHEDISFAVVHTVFEDFEHNTRERALRDQLRYALPVPFGHDDGDGKGSRLMAQFKNGGTPWFLVFEGGRLIAADFRISAAAMITHVEEYMNVHKQTSSGSKLNWSTVLKFAHEGNPTPPRRVERTDTEWRERLTEDQFRVARSKGTERPHSSKMCTVFSPGRYACVCCETELFDASEKFDSRTGWPSFTQPASNNVVGYHSDGSLGVRRIEVTCNVCDAHLGHVFPDGPAPSGLRYCINGVSLSKSGTDTTKEKS